MKNIYLLQASNLGGYRGTFLAWAPYAVGCLWAYVSQFKEITDHIDLKEMMALKEPIGDIVDRLDNPDMFGFSSYVWNFNYNIELKQKLNLVLSLYSRILLLMMYRLYTKEKGLITLIYYLVRMLQECLIN